MPSKSDPLKQYSAGYTYGYSGNGTGHRKHRHVIGYLRSTHKQRGSGYLTGIMKQGSGNAYSYAGEGVCFFKKYHSGKAEHRAGHAVYERGEITEQQAYKKH